MSAISVPLCSFYPLDVFAGVSLGYASKRVSKVQQLSGTARLGDQ